jgi:hypothetical protein
LRGQSSLEDEVAKTDDIADAVHASLSSEIRKTFGDRLANLNKLQAAISDATRERDQATGRSAEAMRGAWTQYTSELYESSEKLFAEYVELVGGVAIRDSGLDRGICRIAEDMLKPARKVGTYTWNNLTIPARRETMSVTAARIVRLGFPEWTIWTLPLAAHELGADLVDGSSEISEYVKSLRAEQGSEEAGQHRGQPPNVPVCLGDAFATYFMGPAYACALILMRLNPASVITDGGLSAKRVAVVLSVLRRMSRNERPTEDMYGPITSRLAVEWEAALRQTGWTSPAETDGQERLEGLSGSKWFPPEEQAAISRHSGLTDEEQATVQRWIEGFEQYVWSKRLDIGAWPTIEVWAQKLRQNEPITDDELGQLDELRYVLNAAWRARIAVTDNETDVDDGEGLQKIAEAAEKLMWKLLARPADADKPKRGQLRIGRQVRDPSVQKPASTSVGPEGT